MEAKYQEITLGEASCTKIKQLYYPDTSWQASHKLVAIKFSHLKMIMKKFYTDKTTIEILQELQRYSHKDIDDVLRETMDDK